MDAFEEDESYEQEQEPTADIDAHEIAERVYRLLCAELRLERARGESPL